MLNLIGNAVKFTAQGEVSVWAELDGETADTITIRFSIRDTGIGLSPEAQARFFQPFEQADRSTTRKFGGTGLGLAISKRLVELMGGRIGVESAVGQGSTFWFTVPFGRGTTAAAPTVDERGAGLHVLVIDGNTSRRTMFERYLAAWRMHGTSAADGAAGLTLLREGSTTW